MLEPGICMVSAWIHHGSLMATGPSDSDVMITKMASRRWLVWAVLVASARAFCPPGCSCDDDGPSARCVGAGVNVVPILFNPGLRRLNLAHNAISSVAQTLVFFDQLRELDLSHNLLSSLGTHNFEMQRHLQELRLAHNNVSVLLPGAFRGLTSLALLDLGHNGLSDLPPAVLGDTPRLTVLLLVHNKLHALVRHAFHGCPALEVLDLCDNYFRHAPTAALEGLGALRVLQLCRNRLTRLEGGAFPTPALAALALQSNSIDHIDEAAFRHLTMLQKLNLNDNLLRDVPAAALDPLGALESLHFGRNQITSLGALAFRSLRSLDFLEVSRCPRLSRLHPEALSRCRKLRSLTLSHNPSLRRLPGGFLAQLPSLRSLDLRANSLQTMGSSDVAWRSLAVLDLRDNPLVCNCSVRWLADLLSAANTSISAPDLQCGAPPKLCGLYLSSHRSCNVPYGCSIGESLYIGALKTLGLK
ncbi:insulin-like growth factor-binding protein complex acid labile subunit [Penaeus indicus]|uniref:insulin-like growth factor-binding protein complex acid labile subunit n=1 Tax=Penaeus indicus TaxID=29960 RepID=UPI00300CF0BC